MTGNEREDFQKDERDGRKISFEKSTVSPSDDGRWPPSSRRHDLELNTGEGTPPEDLEDNIPTSWPQVGRYFEYQMLE